MPSRSSGAADRRCTTTNAASSAALAANVTAVTGERRLGRPDDRDHQQEHGAGERGGAGDVEAAAPAGRRRLARDQRNRGDQQTASR